MFNQLAVFLPIMCLGGCAEARPLWQACIMSVRSGEIECSRPQTRDDADKKALAFNAVGGGAVIAWTQQVPPEPKHGKRPVVVQLPPEPKPDSPPAEPPAQQLDAPAVISWPVGADTLVMPR